MALTQDQSTALQTAIEHLNQSVEVNKQILEILKSVGNTGVVDIATHNNDGDAHSNGLNNLIGKTIKVGDKDASSSNAAKAFRSFTTSGSIESSGGVYTLSESYGTWGSGKTTINTERFYGRNSTITSSDFSGKALASLIYAGYYLNDSTPTVVNAISEFFGFEDDGEASYKFAVYNGSGFYTLFTYRFGSFYNSQAADLGSGTYRWKDCYLQNSPIVSSDERLKQDIEEVPEEVFKAWARVNFKQYRFKEAVASKGDEARKHVGLIAQHILAAFEAEGLDATAYGIVCHDSWDDQYEYEQVIDAEAVFDENGNVVTPEKSHTEKRFVKAAGDVWTVRYEEALALETAYQRWRLAKIEAALEAKGITL